MPLVESGGWTDSWTDTDTCRTEQTEQQTEQTEQIVQTVETGDER
ncbi:hypothetical protein [Streptomyces sp. NRRL WC-3742]|nr:hypothetical protein [Streptomyces sp. NRRL WC-3742]